MWVRRTAFHVAPPGLLSGAVVAPGSWGRQIRQFSPASHPTSGPNWQVTMWEVALESARVARAPSAVSRLDCVFASSNLEAALQFRQKYRQNSAVYEVLLPDQEDSIFRGDFSLISESILKGPYAEIYPPIALRYWIQPPVGTIELLIPVPVTVAQRVA